MSMKGEWIDQFVEKEGTDIDIHWSGTAKSNLDRKRN
jgi:hypothetical protein